MSAEPDRTGQDPVPPPKPSPAVPSEEPEVVAHADPDHEDLPWCISCAG